MATIQNQTIYDSVMARELSARNTDPKQGHTAYLQ